MSFRLVSLGVTAVFVWGVGGYQAAQQTPPQFTATTDLVTIDVSVLDRDRRPVKGLSAKDFTVLENGRTQDISAFAAVDIPDSEDLQTPWMRSVSRDVITNRLGDRRLFVILLDDQVPLDLLALRTAKQAARAVIDRIGPQDLAAVLFINQVQDATEWTNDRGRLTAAVDKFNPRSQYGQSALSSLTWVADALAGIPDRRKAIIYIGAAETVDLDVLTAAVTPGADDPRRPKPDPNADPTGAAREITSGEQTVAVSVFDQLQRLLKRAQSANVTIYGIDPLGLQTPGQVGMVGGVGEQPRLRPLSSDPGRLTREFIQTISYETGGMPIINNNEPAREVPRIFRENGSYYLLGFRSSDPTNDGKLRKLQVKVGRPDVEIRSRRSYLAPRPTPELPNTTPVGPLEQTLKRIIPTSGLPLSVTAAAFAAGPGNAGVGVVVGLPTDPPGSVEVLLSLLNAKGESIASQRGTIPASARESSGVRSDSLQILSRLDSKPGRYDLRVSARNIDSGTTGSVFTTVDIPDFTKDALALSGIIVTQTPAPRSTSSPALRELIPVVPTISRSFERGSAVSLFVRVYQGGSRPIVPTTVTMSLRDQRDVEVFTQSSVVLAPEFSDRARDIRLDLPFQSLTSGPHLLRLLAEIQGNKRASRDVIFDVR